MYIKCDYKTSNSVGVGKGAGKWERGRRGKGTFWSD